MAGVGLAEECGRGGVEIITKGFKGVLNSRGSC
jgi:hypothetical protein